VTRNVLISLISVWIVSLLAACGGGATPETAVADIPYRIYVTNEGSGDLTVIAGGTHEILATVPLGKRPRGIKVGPSGRRLFVALSGSPPAPPGIDESTLPPPDRAADGVGVVDVETGTVTTVLRGGTDPEQVAVGIDGARLYIANEDAGRASILDIASGEVVASLLVGGEPEGVDISPDGRWVYVTSEEDNQVAVIDTAAEAVVAIIGVGPRPRASTFSPDGTRAYVTSENGGTVAMIDTSTHEVIETLTLEGEMIRPMGVVTSPDGGRVYVTTGRGGTVVVIDAATFEPVGSVAVGARPWGLAVTPDGSRLYVANGPSNDVSVVDTDTLTVVDTVTVGERPWGVAIVESDARSARATVSTVIGDGRPGLSDTQVANPYGVVIGPDGGLYFCDLDNQLIRRRDLASGATTTIAGTGERGYSGDGGPAIEATLDMPHEIQFDADGDLYIVERDNHVVRKVDMTSGVISTVAGTGVEGFSGDGGPATGAELNRPHSIAFAPDGRLLICDIGNHRIRRVDLAANTIETFAGTGEREPTPDGAPLAGTPLNGPRAMAISPDGQLYLALREGNAVHRIDLTTETIHHVAGTGEQGYTGDGGPAVAATLAGPKGLGYGNETLYIVDTENHAIREVDLSTGLITTTLGTGVRGDGPEPNPRACRMSRPHGVWVADQGALYVGDSEAHRIRVLR
jgi:PQQ-dependent catabolism-associated beta-propeller protein